MTAFVQHITGFIQNTTRLVHSYPEKPFFTLESEAHRDGPPTQDRSGHLNVVPPAPARTEQRCNFWTQRSVPMWNSLSNQANMATNVNMSRIVTTKKFQKEVINKKINYQ